MAETYAVGKQAVSHRVIVDNNVVSTREEKNGTDQSRYEWVEVPDEDLFGVAHTGVSINFEQFGPGRYFVDPEKAYEIRRLLKNRLRSDMRVLQPNRDKKMEEIMRRDGKPVPNQV